jgi:hypothetical protein
LVGIGALAIPGVGPFIAAGPISRLAGAARRSGRWSHRRAGWSRNPRVRGQAVRGKILKGNILISVHTETSNEIDRAKEILKREGAQDISYTGEAPVKAA